MTTQTFVQTDKVAWLNLPQFPGTEILSLAAPVADGSIHRLRMQAGTEIPFHTHPCDNMFMFCLER